MNSKEEITSNDSKKIFRNQSKRINASNWLITPKT